jgi:tRNA 2-thiouridine synthesizing protein A
MPPDEIEVDARGHRCPVPTLRLRRALEAATPGSVVRLLADDPLARIDVPHFAAQAGVELLEIADLDRGWAFRVRAPPPQGEGDRA